MTEHDPKSWSQLLSDQYDVVVAEKEALAAENAALTARLSEVDALKATLIAALSALVKINEDWNAAVESVIGRDPKWSAAYLEAAKAALAQARETP